MDIIKIGTPIVTKMKTVVTRYVENGRLYKSIDFEKSANKYAKQKGLVKTIVRYGEGNKPETIFDTFERQIKKATGKKTPKIEDNQIQAKKKRGRKPKQKPTEVAVDAGKKVPKKTPEIQPADITKPAEKAGSTTKAVAKRSKTICKERLVPLSPDTFKRETTKKIYSKIHKYVDLIGNNGVPNKEIKILRGSGTEYDDADIFLSLKRTGKELHLSLTSKDIDKKRNYLLLDAVFNKDGQMINGKFPFKNLTFERHGANIRRMSDKEHQYLPISGNDREWDCFGNRISSSCSCIRSAEDDNAVGATFELFLEFARLHTSIFK